MLWLRHFLHTLAADNKDTRCCTGSFWNNVQLTGKCRSTHLGDRTQGISSLFPDPSRRTREPPSSGCISSRHSGSPLQFSKIQMARVQRASAPAPALQWLLRIPLDPRPSAVTSQLQARQQVANPSAAVPETEHTLLLAAHCLLSSNGDLPRHKPGLSIEGACSPFASSRLLLSF